MPQPSTLISTDELLAQIIEAKATLELVKGRLAGLLDQLSTALDHGEIDHKFSHDDWAFTYCEGRTTVTYSDAAKASIKSIQEADLAAGTATQKTGTGFWTIKAPSI